jgi:hypothetical protein
MKLKLIKHIIPIAIIITLMASCSSSKIVLSNNANIDKYKYVILGNESSDDRELDDIVMAVQNQIAAINLQALSTSNISKASECSDGSLTPKIHVTSEKWDGGHTYITVTFYDYNNNQRITAVESNGIGMTVSHDQDIALGAIRKKIKKLSNNH